MQNTCPPSRLATGALPLLAALLSWVVAPSPARAQTPAPPPAPAGIRSDAVYLREPTDQLWQITIRRDISALAGLYLFLHDKDGRVLLQRHLPPGNYSSAQPLVLAVPADQHAGEYRLMFMGEPGAIAALPLPLTDLPGEVYGRWQFENGSSGARFVYRAPTGLVAIRTYGGGTIRLFDGAQQIGDVMKDGQQVPKEYELYRTLRLDVNPATYYQLEVSNMYFQARSEGGLLLALKADLWFDPDPALDQIQWWRLFQPREKSP